MTRLHTTNGHTNGVVKNRTATSIDMMPARSQQAEQVTLAAMMRDNLVIDYVLQHVKATSFFEDAHQKIFTSIVFLHNAGSVADFVTVSEWLITVKQIDDVGGVAYLGELLNFAPSGGNAVYYAKIVKEKKILRDLVSAGSRIVNDANNNVNSPDEQVSQAERLISGINSTASIQETHSMAHCVPEARERIERRISADKKGITGISTGYDDLDTLTSGLHNGELVIIGGRPSDGKTLLAGQLALNAAMESKVPTLFLSLEQSRMELTERLAVSQARISGHRLRGGNLNPDEAVKLSDAFHNLLGVPLWINDSRPQTVHEIRSLVRRGKQRHGVGLVLIDYLQYVEPDDRHIPKNQQVGEISKRCKFIAHEQNIPVILLSQLNRGKEYRTRGNNEPVLSDLKESGDIEQDGDVVFLLHRPVDNEGVLDIYVRKQRNGPTGKVRLAHIKDQLRYENYAETPFAF